MNRAHLQAGPKRLLALTELFVQRKLIHWPEFVAALVVGSLAHGEARPDSDVDCLFLFNPVDERIMPAEFVWVPETDNYYTIDADAVTLGGIQIDARRLSLAAFSTESWAEGFKNELASAVLVCDRSSTIQQVLDARLVYPDDLRAGRLFEYYARAEYYATEWRLRIYLERGWILAAHDQLNAAFEEIIRLLHAYNRIWLPWRKRWLTSTQKLTWLPDQFNTSMERIQGRIGLSTESVLDRMEVVTDVLNAIKARIESDGIDLREAFKATHIELGYRHNMDMWKTAHREFVRKRGFEEDLRQ